MANDNDVGLHFKLPKSLRNELKIYTAKNDINMKDFLVDIINEKMNELNVKEKK